MFLKIFSAHHMNYLPQHTSTNKPPLPPQLKLHYNHQ